ncbi:MAG: ATP-binding protein [Pirellula sp.]
MSVVMNLPGSFYLGRRYDLADRKRTESQVHYESKHLTTHALCVGMTGSGKTGLCVSLLEEAALDGIPIICIDPKGDLGNLLLTFPELKADDFKRWLDKSEVMAKRSDDDRDLSDEELLSKTAAQTADSWANGLRDWEMNLEYLKTLDQIEKVIYTPGSNVGVPLTVLSSLDAPSREVLDDDEALRDQISSAVSGLLALLGVNADPLTSREHILLSTILKDGWSKGQDISMENLIRFIQTPPVKKVGVMDIDSFFSPSDRGKLAMSLNNLLASPAFAGWMQGQALDIESLLYTSSGAPKISIISIAHLNDSERMFFVTILLNELVSWMRSQNGTSALRAIFYMDEIYGYFPPAAKPPSKGPMMTLLKQARAFGLGIVLATQNPVDLDYKGLSNMGTWFLGRLQTQRDKDRVLDGLEGASLQQGASFDRNAMDKNLSALGKRVFLLNNVNDNAPTIFQTRWAFSFLRGPLSRPEISGLMQSKKSLVLGGRDQSNSNQGQDRDTLGAKSPSGATDASVSGSVQSGPPIVPAGVEVKYLVPNKAFRPSNRLEYRPALFANASIHFVRATGDVDVWNDLQILTHIDQKVGEQLWEDSKRLEARSYELSEPERDFSFVELPVELLQVKNYKAWERELAEYLFRHEKCVYYSCKVLKRNSSPGQSELDARMEFAQFARESRDQEMEKLRAKYEDKLRTLQSKVLMAQQRVDKLVDEAKSKRMDGLVNLGTSIFGALLGNKTRSGSRTSSAVRDLTNAASKGSDISRAQETLDELILQKDQMERECLADIERVKRDYSVENLVLEPVEVPLRKSDTKIKTLWLAWVPWQIDPQGNQTCLVETIDG